MIDIKRQDVYELFNSALQMNVSGGVYLGIHHANASFEWPANDINRGLRDHINPSLAWS